MASEYEKLRLKNLEDNRRILAEIGLVNPYKALPKVTFKKRGIKRKAENEVPRSVKKRVVEDLDSQGSLRGSRRRSARVQGQVALSELEIKEQLESEDDEDRPRRVAPNRPNFYGPVPNIEIGTVWLMRMECCHDGVHRPPVCGIHGGPEGAYSIALSGEYEDNLDLGECFTYTGEGGRDLRGTKNKPKNLRTAPQSKDQTLDRGNLALSRNVTTGKPVRVIRGYKLQSPFAPREGYRYDGLYTVEKFWFTTGLSGFGVWKFALRRCKDQAPPPWEFIESGSSPSKSKSEDENVSFVKKNIAKSSPSKTDSGVESVKSSPSKTDSGVESGKSSPSKTDSGIDSEDTASSSGRADSDVASVNSDTVADSDEVGSLTGDKDSDGDTNSDVTNADKQETSAENNTNPDTKVHDSKENVESEHEESETVDKETETEDVATEDGEQVAIDNNSATADDLELTATPLDAEHND